jgi:hypothetical protein
MPYPPAMVSSPRAGQAQHRGVEAHTIGSDLQAGNDEIRQLVRVLAGSAAWRHRMEE